MNYFKILAINQSFITAFQDNPIKAYNYSGFADVPLKRDSYSSALIFGTYMHDTLQGNVAKAGSNHQSKYKICSDIALLEKSGVKKENFDRTKSKTFQKLQDTSKETLIFPYEEKRALEMKKVFKFQLKSWFHNIYYATVWM